MGNNNNAKTVHEKTVTTINIINPNAKIVKKSQKDVGIKFNLIKLLNSFRNFQIDFINERVLEVCHYQQIKYLNYRLFMLMFPKIKSNYSNFKDKLIKKIFTFFDKSHDGYIRPIHLLECLSIIYYTDIFKFGQVLIYIFSLNVKKNIIDKYQVCQFYKSNKIFFNSFATEEESTQFQQELQAEDYSINSFNQLIYKNFDINKFKALFDCFELEHQIKFIEEIKNFEYVGNQRRGTQRSIDSIPVMPQTSDNRFIVDKQKNELSISKRHHLIKQTQAFAKVCIKINENDIVYLVEVRWFKQWVQYLMAHHIQSVHFIINNKQKNIFQNQIQKILDKQYKINKPNRLSNKLLIGEYQNQLKPGLVEFKHFVCLPRHIWQGLKQIYKGGPQIQRKYPYFYPIILFRVFINNKGIFQQNSIQKYVISNQKKIKQIFQHQQQSIKNIKEDHKIINYYMCRIRNVVVKTRQHHESQILKQYQYVYQYQSQSQDQQVISSLNQFAEVQQLQKPHNKWQIIPENTVISLQHNQNFNRAFICLVQQQKKNLFEQNYILSNEKIAYGDEVYINATVKIKSNIIQLKKQGVKIHHQGKNFLCDTFYTYKQLEEIKKMNIITLPNSIPIFVNQIMCEEKQNINMKTNSSSRLSKLNSLLQQKLTTPLKEQIIINDTFIKTSLYCLLHSPFFSEYLLKNQYYYDIDKKISKKKNTMAQKLSNLTKQLFNQDTKGTNSISLKQFKQILGSKCAKYRDKNKIVEPDQFIADILHILEQQLLNVDRFLADIIEVTNSNEGTIIDHSPESLNIINQLFSYNLLINKQFECCENKVSETRTEKILKLPINEDKQMIFEGIFYPVYQKKLRQLTKYGVRMQLSRKFQQFSEQFFLLIKEDFPQIENKNQLRFTLVKNGQFIRHFQKNDYESTLSFLNISKQTNRQQSQIIIYELRQAQINYMSQINNYHEVNFEIGSFVDFKSYSEWRIGKIIESSQKTVKILNYEYLNNPKLINKQKVYPYKSKTGVKNKIFIEVLHRAQKEHKITYNLKLDPILINITEFMTKDQIEQNIINEISRYIRDYDILRIQNKISKISRTKTQSIKEEIQSKIKNKNYEIRYMKKNTKDICYFCDKKSKFINKADLHANNCCYGKNYCKGIQVKNDDPIGWLVDLKKIYITIDWQKEFSSYERIFHEHQSCKDSVNYFEINKNDITSSLEYIANFQIKEEVNCKQCHIPTLSRQKIYIVKLPNLLIIKLERFKKILGEMRKIDIEVEANQILSLEKIAYTLHQSCQYELYGIICHDNSKLQQGKFYCYIQKNKYWIRCDQNSTTKVDLKEIKTNQIHMAFYKSMNFSAYLTSKII